jgi:MFS family permease
MITADRSYRALLAIPTLPRLLVGMTLARIVASMAPVALVLFTLEQFGSPAFAGLVTFAATAPAVLVSPIAGALLDRHGRARLVVVAYLFGAACTAAIGALALAARLPELVLIGLAVLAALTAPIANNGVRSLLPLLVPEPLWERLNALDANAFVLGLLLGPPIAGVLVQVLGGATAMVAIGGLLALASLTLVGVREPPIRGSTGPLLASALDGLRYVWFHRTLRGLALSVIPFYFAYGMLTIVLPVIVLERLTGGPAVVGLLWGTMAISGGVAAFVFGGRNSRDRERRWMAAAMLATAAAYTVLAPAPNLALVVAALLVAGFANGPLDIALFTLRQRATDPAWMGRAFSVSAALNGAGSPFGAALAGWLVTRSVEAAVLVGAAACVVGALAAWRLLPAPDPTYASPRP